MNSFCMKVITSQDVCAVRRKKLLACERTGHKLKTKIHLTKNTKFKAN